MINLIYNEERLRVSLKNVQRLPDLTCTVSSLIWLIQFTLQPLKINSCLEIRIKDRNPRTFTVAFSSSCRLEDKPVCHWTTTVLAFNTLWNFLFNSPFSALLLRKEIFSIFSRKWAHDVLSNSFLAKEPFVITALDNRESWTQIFTNSSSLSRHLESSTGQRFVQLSRSPGEAFEHFLVIFLPRMHETS